MSTPGGRAFLLTIAGYMNSNRYTTNPKGVPSAPDYGLLYNLLSGPSPINPNSNLTHEVLTLKPPQIVSTRSLPIHGATDRRLVITVAPHRLICP